MIAPDAHDCGCTQYLCEVCNPRRTLIRAMLQQSMRATERRMRPDNVQSLAFARLQREMRRASCA